MTMDEDQYTVHYQRGSVRVYRSAITHGSWRNAITALHQEVSRQGGTIVRRKAWKAQQAALSQQKKEARMKRQAKKKKARRAKLKAEKQQKKNLEKLRLK